MHKSLKVRGLSDVALANYLSLATIQLKCRLWGAPITTSSVSSKPLNGNNLCPLVKWLWLMAHALVVKAANKHLPWIKVTCFVARCSAMLTCAKCASKALKRANNSLYSSLRSSKENRKLRQNKHHTIFSIYTTAERSWDRTPDQVKWPFWPWHDNLSSLEKT